MDLFLKKCLDLLRKMFIGLFNACTVESFGASLPSYYKEPIKCIFLNNQTCQARPTFVDISSNEVLFYQFAVVNKCDVSCNTIDDPCS